MKTLYEIEKEMLTKEAEFNKTIPENQWIILRLDGNNFTTLTNECYQKPFDEMFQKSMLEATQSLMERFSACYAYTGSDEISLVLPRSYDQYDRRLQKIVSLSASLASSVFSLSAKRQVQFDCRLLSLDDETQVLEYSIWRITETRRNAVSTALFWELRRKGNTARQVTNLLHSVSTEGKERLLRDECDIEFSSIDEIYRHGTNLMWKEYQKEGYDPIQQKIVMAKRRKIVQEKIVSLGEHKELLFNYLLSF